MCGVWNGHLDNCHAKIERREAVRKEDEIFIFWLCASSMFFWGGFHLFFPPLSVPYVIVLLSLSSLFDSASGEHSREVKS